MMLMWLIPLVLVLAFLLPNKGQRLSKWTWVALAALFALPFVGMLFMHNVGGFAGGFSDRYNVPMGGPMERMMGGGRGMMGPGNGYGMMRPGFGHGYSGVGAWGGVCMALVLVGIGLVAYVLYKRRQNAPEAAPVGDEALRELRMRLARGEVSPEDFDLLQQKLKG